MSSPCPWCAETLEGNPNRCPYCKSDLRAPEPKAARVRSRSIRPSEWIALGVVLAALGWLLGLIGDDSIWWTLGILLGAPVLAFGLIAKAVEVGVRASRD